MNIRRCWSKLLVVAALALTSACFGAVLNVPYYTQEKDQWCWNASSQMALKFYGKTYSQTAIAAWAVGGQNVPNYLYGSDSTKKGCDLILSHFGNINATGLAYAMTLSALNTEMANSRPVIIRWGWNNGGGHILVVRGTSGNSVYINDPWPANGQSVNSYDWVKQGDGHTWTHTLKINASPVNPYYQYYIANYNKAMAYLNQYNSTGSRLYLAYYNYYYAYAGYYYYKYTNDNSNAHYWLNYCLANAYYYYYYYYNQNTVGYCYAMRYYHYYLAKAYYYGYYYAGNYRAAYKYYYYNRAYEYYYMAYAYYYYYASYGNYSAANYYYNSYMNTAASYYNLARQYW